MEHESQKPTLGLALSGSGNRTTFYIGFLEVLDEAGIKPDYISACSGGSLVAAAYACGNLQAFKKMALGLTNENFKAYIGKGHDGGGMYSLDLVEEKMREYTQGHTFEEIRPLMSFVTVDIETGEQVDLCMGDIARAARISCTLPGVFEPVKWGSRTLVDGGLLSFIPLDSLKQFSVDITIGVNMRGTKHIFSETQITLKRVFNVFKKLLFIDEMESLLHGLINKDEINFEKNPKIFTVLGKSLDLAIQANKQDKAVDISCDLLITPTVPLEKQDIFSQFNQFYGLGRASALENLPKIKELITQKTASKQTLAS